MNSLDIFSIIIAIWCCFISDQRAAITSGYNSEMISPYTGKRYFFPGSSTLATFKSAHSICKNLNGRLATLETQSSDIPFLGSLLPLDTPFWIGGLDGTAFGTTKKSPKCAAIYAGGAIAIPKSWDPREGPCANMENILCELDPY